MITLFFFLQIVSHIDPVVRAIWSAVLSRGVCCIKPFEIKSWSRKQSHNFRLIAVFVFAVFAFTFAIVLSPPSVSPSPLPLPVPSPHLCLCLRHRLVVVFAFTSSPSLPSPHRRLRLITIASSPSSPHRRLRLITIASSPSSPSPSPSFRCCLRLRRHLIAVFNFAIVSSPSSSLPISSPVA
ncbi:uncharacterized protein LOC116924397 isoform X2 [Daphnia magna]|uniref:uncharacterized protein LOC116924397 isoform X2 n=1 Tax=Daphnia magna TaxID=35525 RepID=UPI001E1BD2A2|nr:uncharacterized protein LOC116924397 isoform X2 [Daphnia magna]